MTDLLLGIDIGTSSSKGVLVEPSGEIVARASKLHHTSNPRPGWFEHDAERIWWTDFCELTRELLATTAGRRIAAVAVSGIGPCLLPADAAGFRWSSGLLFRRRRGRVTAGTCRWAVIPTRPTRRSRCCEREPALAPNSSE